MQNASVAAAKVKVKSDHYVIARRTWEAVRGALISAVSKGASVNEALGIRKRMRNGMKELKDISGCVERHVRWSEFAVTSVPEAWLLSFQHG